MTFVTLVLLAAAYVSSGFSDVGKSDVIEGLKNLTRGKDTKKARRLIDRIEQDFDSMHKLQKSLSEGKENLDPETPLTREQAELLKRLKSFERKVYHKLPHKGNSVERVNMRSGTMDALFQGDMVLSKEQQDEVIADIGDSRSKRQADNDRTHPNRKWPNAVFYSLDGSLDDRAKAAFKKAAELWMKDTCVDFKEDLQEEAEDLLLVYKEHGCWAEVGRQGGWQLLSLGDVSCETIGMATHEIGHALGFWHTHSRFDRNDYITVLKRNIQRAQRRQFGKKSRKNNYNYNLPYDYGSVMHYGARSFITDTAANKGELTIVPKDINYTETLGSSIIAFYDLLMMNIYYNCTDACREEKTKCRNEGFVHPRNCSKCICPSGYGGQLCDERPPGCGEELHASETWKTLEDNLNGNETGPDGYSRCNYWIKAPFGKRIEIKILRAPPSHLGGCPYAGVEIKTHSDQRLTGYRFCSSFFVNTILTSHSNLVPVITYTNGMLDEDQGRTDGESDDESEDDEYHEESDEYDNEDEFEDEDDDDDDEDIGSVVKLEYRYV